MCYSKNSLENNNEIIHYFVDKDGYFVFDKNYYIALKGLEELRERMYALSKYIEIVVENFGKSTVVYGIIKIHTVKNFNILRLL